MTYILLLLLSLQDVESLNTRINEFSYSMIEDTIVREEPPAERFDIRYELTRNNKLIDDPLTNTVAFVGDGLLFLPEILLDLIIQSIDDINGQATNDNSTITSKIFDINAQSSRDHLFSIYVQSYLDRERKYLIKYHDITMYDINDDIIADIDMEKFKDDQQDVMIDALKDMYFSKYKLNINDRTREAYNFYEWSGIDYATLPVMISALLYYRGFDRRISMDKFECAVSLEAINSIVRQDNIPFALSFELGLKDFPIKFIMSAGVSKGDLDTSFIGIGTSISAARRSFIVNEPLQNQ